MILVSTSLDQVNAERLRRLSERIGAHLVKDWSRSCTHLVTHAIKSTPKLVFALCEAKPIVTLEYIELLGNRKNGLAPLPDSIR